jgi:demethylmenaquinone methyltransferase / 2-methoxy-6-polyprenyl-1,4-benzoquinol methylase
VSPVHSPEKPIWTAEGQEKRDQVQAMFEQIAPTYDRCNAWMSFRQHHRWRAKAVALLNLKSGDRVLDLCCGTGDFFRPIRASIGENGELLGMDFCAPMLERATSKDSQATIALGDATRLPVTSTSVDAVTVGWGIRNVPDIDAAHREIFRVLRPGGRFVSLDMAVPKSAFMRAGSRFVTLKLLPLLGAAFGSKDAYTYLPESTQRFWSREKLSDSMRAAGFESVRTVDLFFGNICIHFGQKGDPR